MFWQSCSLAGCLHAAFSLCQVFFSSIRISVLGFLEEQQTFRHLRCTYSICTGSWSEFYWSRKSVQMISSRQSTFRRIKKPENCRGWVRVACTVHACLCDSPPTPIVLMPSSLQARKTQRQQQCDRLRPPHAHTGEEIWQRFASQHVPVTHTGSPQDRRGASGRKSGNHQRTMNKLSLFEE